VGLLGVREGSSSCYTSAVAVALIVQGIQNDALDLDRSVHTWHGRGVWQGNWIRLNSSDDPFMTKLISVLSMPGESDGSVRIAMKSEPMVKAGYQELTL
jgi:hypothetical protein